MSPTRIVTGAAVARLGAWAAALVVGAAPAAAVQDPGEGPYGSPEARALHRAAVERHALQADELVQYTARVRHRVGASLRTPLKDRTLYRAEASHRVFWNRGGDVLVQVLALREQTPLGVNESATRLGLFDQSFDPLEDRLFFGLVDTEEYEYVPPEDRHDFWFEHPLVEGYEDGYRFEVGDTLTLTLPDGRRLEAVELEVIPTEADVHRMSGSLWIEPESGALVRAVYRLADSFDAFRDVPDLQEEEDEDLKWVPGLLKPWTAEIQLFSVDYALWDFDVWLPRTMRAEGVVRAGVLSAPMALEIAYDVESVVTRRDLEEAAERAPVEELRFRTRAEAMEALTRETVGEVEYRLEPGWSTRRRGRERGMRYRYLVPEDPAWLQESPELPPPIWKDAPGFPSEAEIGEMFDELAELPMPPLRGVPSTFRWGIQRPDLVRYNRIEGLSIGARGQLRPPSPVGPLSVTATARLATAALDEPDLRLDVVREGLRRRFAVSVFHELAAVDEGGRHLGIGNSLNALLFGRDDGEYYRRSGAWVAWTPPAAERRSFEVRAYGEYHRPAEVATDFSLWNAAADAWAFRDNVAADEGWEVGGLLRLSPWWGTDPRMAQAGLDWTLQAAGGDVRYARSSLEAKAALPLVRDVRLGLVAGGGRSWGEPSVQRLWILGGAHTLRGHAPRTLQGPAYLRARAELARQFAFGALSAFWDAGWAGEASEVDLDDALHAVGAGISLVDGLIRMDAAWGLTDPQGGFRLELYLDGIL